MELHLCLLPRTQRYRRYDYRRRPAFYLCVEPGDREAREEDHVLRHCSAYRVRIVIPASEMWEAGNERPDYVLQNMVGASIDLVIIKVEREAGFAIGSRRLASRSQRYFFAHREDLHHIGSA